MDDKPTYHRRAGCAAEVLQRELFQLQTGSPAEGASVVSAACKRLCVGGCAHKPAHTCVRAHSHISQRYLQPKVRKEICFFLHFCRFSICLFGQI